MMFVYNCLLNYTVMIFVFILVLVHENINCLNPWSQWHNNAWAKNVHI